MVAYFEFKGQFRTLRKRKILLTFVIQPFPDIDTHFPSDRYGRLLAGVHRERGDVPHHPGLLCRIRQRGRVRVLQLGDWLLRRQRIWQGKGGIIIAIVISAAAAVFVAAVVFVAAAIVVSAAAAYAQLFECFNFTFLFLFFQLGRENEEKTHSRKTRKNERENMEKRSKDKTGRNNLVQQLQFNSVFSPPKKLLS